MAPFLFSDAVVLVLSLTEQVLQAVWAGSLLRNACLCSPCHNKPACISGEICPIAATSDRLASFRFQFFGPSYRVDTTCGTWLIALTVSLDAVCEVTSGPCQPSFNHMAPSHGLMVTCKSPRLYAKDTALAREKLNAQRMVHRVSDALSHAGGGPWHTRH